MRPWIRCRAGPHGRLSPLNSDISEDSARKSLPQLLGSQCAPRGANGRSPEPGYVWQSMEPQPDRIELADRVFSAALELPPDQRAAFVQQRCGDDITLTQTVLHWLSQYQRLGDFLEAPAFERKQPLAGEFPPGEVLNGRFRLIELVGRGGMGEVYRAEDSELGDTVALKVLRSRFRGEEEIDARFRGEIRLARKISHPNVCRIFELFVETRGLEHLLYFT